MADSRKLGELLVQAGEITSDQLRTALEYKKSIGGPLGTILVKLGFVDEEAVMAKVARQQGLPIVDLAKIPLKPETVARIPREILEKHCAIPVRMKDGVLTVAMASADDYDAIEEMEFVSDCSVEVALAGRAAIQQAINRACQQGGSAPRPRGTPAAPEAAGAEKPVSAFDIRRALIPLLVEKGLITEAELIRKARELS